MTPRQNPYSVSSTAQTGAAGRGDQPFWIGIGAGLFLAWLCLSLARYQFIRVEIDDQPLRWMILDPLMLRNLVLGGLFGIMAILVSFTKWRFRDATALLVVAIAYFFAFLV